MRRTSEIRIPVEDGNRDSGKLFIVTEMPALQGFKWATDALRMLARAGVDVLPDDIQQPNMALLAGMGFKALSMMDGAEVDGLMDRLYACVVYVPDPGKREITRQPSDFTSDVEEIMTHLLLRKAAWDLSVGFLLSALRSKDSVSGSTTALNP